MPGGPTVLLCLTFSKTSNISYDRGRVRGSSFGRHSPIQLLDIDNVGIISSPYICNSSGGRLLSGRQQRDLTKKGGTE